MISTPAFLISKRETKSFNDIRKCRKDINIIKSAITSDSSNYMGAGAPAKTKKCMPAGIYFFREKVRLFPHLARFVNIKSKQKNLRKGVVGHGTDKKKCDFLWKQIQERRKCIWQMERENTALI